MTAETYDLTAPLEEMMREAAGLRDCGHGDVVTYSRKVFIPLTRLCRDVCGYCTFAHRPRPGERAYLTVDEVLAIAHAGRDAGCTEALFTLGDRPESRYRVAREELAAIGASSTVDYLVRMCERVLDETGLLPHTNAGVLERDELARLRAVSASQGLMLESTAERLCARGGVHFGSPDKHPRVRVEMLRNAGELAIPVTTGILIGIGESRDERLHALRTIGELHAQYGHVQEVIVQPFRAKRGTRMAQTPDTSHEELLWTLAAARLILGPDMNIQAPPNLSPRDTASLLDAGINDWGGVSPVTIDHVNPEAPWPEIEALERITASKGKLLVARLPSYPCYVREARRWHSKRVAQALVRASDATGHARLDAWSPGLQCAAPALLTRPTEQPSLAVREIVSRARAGETLSEPEITRLFNARGADLEYVLETADALRRDTVGDTVRYVVNRNLNYTNICAYHCTFCAFSKGVHGRSLRGDPYDLPLEEIERRVAEAWARGATEVCMQGGIHPRYDGRTYLRIVESAKRAAPHMHVHAFTPLEVTHGATTLGLSVRAFLRELIEAGLGTLPGTAAEILDDDVRRRICPDKVTSDEWLDVMETAHALGLRSTATIMFGHVEAPVHWARHLLRVRALQARTHGFTEFIPLPFVHMASPVYLSGEARKGPTFREAVLMHAVARLVLHPLIANVQVSWVKMGEAGVRACLAAGANDAGGTLMNESISRAAGTQHGQEMPPAAMDHVIRAAGRVPAQRTTLYGAAPVTQYERSYQAAPLAAMGFAASRLRGGRSARA